MSRTVHHRMITRTDIGRVVLGWGAVAALLLIGPALQPPLPLGVLAVVLAVIVAVIVVCAFGVVKQAEALAKRLGDPYGSLVLTLSIVLIEVILIAAVMLGPGEHTTIARDSVMAVAMIIMNLVIGLSLLLGGLRRGGMAHNRSGTSAYLSMLIVLIALAFALPGLVGEAGSFAARHEVPVIVITLALYAFFLIRQLGAQAGDFREVDACGIRAPHAAPMNRSASTNRAAPVSRPEPIIVALRAHRREIVTRLVLLVVTVLPIVLLSHDMAALLDDALGRVGAPVALVGVLIAMIVFLPESLASVRAALGGEVQRVINLCHGALVSTVGLTIPAVLIIGMLTGQTVVLAESPVNLLMLGVTLLLSVATFAAQRVTAIHGAVHLVVFVVYGIALFG